MFSSAKVSSSFSAAKVYWCLRCSSPGTILRSYLCWTSWDFSVPIFPTSLGLSEEHCTFRFVSHSSQVCVLFKLWLTIPDHLWKGIAVLAPVLSLEIHKYVYRYTDLPPAGFQATLWAQQLSPLTIHVIVHFSNPHFSSLSVMAEIEWLHWSQVKHQLLSSLLSA